MFNNFVSSIFGSNNNNQAAPQQAPPPQQVPPPQQISQQFTFGAPQQVPPPLQQSPNSAPPPQQFNINMNNSFNSSPIFSPNFGGASTRRLGPKDFSKEKYKEKECAALIITINTGGSFDDLYHHIDQTPPNPEQYVSVFLINYSMINHLQFALENNFDYQENCPEILKEMFEEMNKLDGENIVINWECCSGCSESGFNSGFDQTVFAITKQAISRKMISMFSDFSLKALIHCWRTDLLGPNPFVRCGSFGSNFKLKFDPKTLIDCPFAQLQNVGELCENGTADVSAMGSTILYSVSDQYLRENPPYKLTVLTIVESADRISKAADPKAISLGDHKGLAGHVMLEYENGGTILTSCGHWIELVRLDVSMASVLSHAEKKYGEEYAKNLSVQLNSCSVAEQSEQLRFISNNYVQSSAPCKYKSSSKNF